MRNQSKMKTDFRFSTATDSTPTTNNLLLFFLWKQIEANNMFVRIEIKFGQNVMGTNLQSTISSKERQNRTLTHAHTQT